LSRAVERLFDDATERLFGGAKAGSAAVTPAMDVAETDTTYQVVLDVPGATRDALKVTIEGRRLSIETVAEAATSQGAANGTADAAKPIAVDAAQPAAEASDASAAAPSRERLIYRERGIARYARTVILPAEVDQAASQAKVENGVLTLTLVKKVPTGARQISIS
jgi:HSP20 family protein